MVQIVDNLDGHIGFSCAGGAHDHRQTRAHARLDGFDLCCRKLNSVGFGLVGRVRPTVGLGVWRSNEYRLALSSLAGDGNLQRRERVKFSGVVYCTLTLNGATALALGPLNWTWWLGKDATRWSADRKVSLKSNSVCWVGILE